MRGLDECWPWLGNKGGGARVKYGRVPISGNRWLGAHRVVYEAFVGPITDGLMVLHHCDNGLCVNPRHLYVGSHADNMRDKVRRGRQTRGEKMHTAKLTSDDVRRIREDPRIQREIAKDYGVHQAQISRIKRNIQWKENQWIPKRHTN